MPRRPRIVIAHDYLTQRGGAERVVLAMARAFPGAPVVTTLYDPDGTYPECADLDIRVSPLNRVPLLRHSHRLALPLLAPTVSRMPLDADVVIASSSGWAHGFPTTGRKLVYCHSPARWLYQTEQYLGSGAAGSARAMALAPLKAPLTRWDRRAARTADVYVANSTVVAERIQRVYGFHAGVLFPPVGLDPDGPQATVGAASDWAEAGFHLLVSRLLPYKNVEPVVAAFRRMPDRRLVVVGAGPLRDTLAATLPATVRLVSDLDDAQLRWLYAHCTAVVAPSHEDFGLTPVEGMSHGKPTVALRGGGYLDTVVEGHTGVFFEVPEPEEIVAAVRAAAETTWDARSIRSESGRFAEGRFAARLQELVGRLEFRETMA